MEIRSYGALTEPDPRSLAFTPWGSGTIEAIEAAAEDFQRSVAHADLAAAVPDQVRGSFDRIRKLYALGLIEYEMFTVTNDLSLLLLEHALAERFVEFYGGTIPFCVVKGPRAGVMFPLVAASFEGVYEACHWGTHKGSGLRLQLTTGKLLPFRGSLADLFNWARMEGLLPGQRSRRLDSLLVTMRNRIAHARDYHLMMPFARWIVDTAEIINQLWGAPTPGGRLFPDRLSPDPPVGWVVHGFRVGSGVGDGCDRG